MAQTATANRSSGREAALARRRAMSSGGKAGVQTVQASPSQAATAAPAKRPAGTAVASSDTGRNASMARRRAMSSAGKAGIQAGSTQAASASSAPAARPAGTAGGSPSASGRSASMARRRAMSSHGKQGIATTDRTRATTGSTSAAPAAQAAATPVSSDDSSKRGDCSCGCKKRDGEPGTAPAPRVARTPNATPRRPSVAMSSGRAASVARRRALSSRGKAGVGKSGLSAAQTARAANPDLSGRELAQALRKDRSRNGKSGKTCTDCSGQRRQRNKAPAQPAAAEDASWKVGAGETTGGQVVTGTMVGRSHSVTGDEPSTCRAVTGTEYLGADIFRDFCQTDPQATPRKVGISPTGRGNAATGTRVGRSTKVTGDEPGTCKMVTGTEYVGSDQSQAFCGTATVAGPSKISRAETRKGKSVTGSNVGRSAKVTGDEPGAGRELTGTQYMQSGDGSAPAKVGVSATLRSGSVTGTLVGRSQHVTGDEPGSCKNITGDDYVGKEQYGDFCAATPAPTDIKSGVSRTMTGETVTGTMTGRSSAVTGDEPGTCKAITGTPYAGMENYQGYCDTDQASSAAARMQHSMRAAGAPMTGKQPAVGGVMTGDAKGACETVSGTPYVGADQMAEACPARPAEPNSPDFPQAGAAPWGQFSVESPNHAAQSTTAHSEITGSAYEQGRITGPFGMAPGKVTGTEEARFGKSGGTQQQLPEPPQLPEDARVGSRVTGEGMDAGPKITGDDWERGDNVTGTEGASAVVRNPTRGGGAMSVMAPLRTNARNEDLPEPRSKVTGSSGNTERGSLITYSGGARG